MSDSPYINRFLQPDTLIPDPANPQSFNRYSYVLNRPVNFNDPTGHMQESDPYKCHGCTNRDDWNLPPITNSESGDGGGGEENVISSGNPATNNYICLLNCVKPILGYGSYVVGAGGSMRGLIALKGISTTLTGNKLIIYGPRANRTLIGINPYTNRILLTNVGTKFGGPLSFAKAGTTSGWTWVGIGMNVTSDTITWQQGGYTNTQYLAASAFEIETGLISAASAGAVQGLAYTYATGPWGWAAGIGVGLLVGVGSYYMMSTYKDEFVNTAQILDPNYQLPPVWNPEEGYRP